ncbi:uncharacterized protein LOC117327740 isoform X2 [Pecten maximus]|uniref:uncharacterized protein LOC117327740 isoform X2 n=1 Tax=Pecten maximus TaxID=6579 RepID=UPI00145882F7|nr:uncharacterized protein LOC117327740 isoform X2 [Pecten maximus]
MLTLKTKTRNSLLRCAFLFPMLWEPSTGIVAEKLKKDTTASNRLIMNALVDLIRNPVYSIERESRSEILRGIYTHLKYHPVLMERRLHVGSHPPQSNSHTQKRDGSFVPGMAQPACPYNTDWRLIYQAKDINDSDVEVFQPTGSDISGRQWFYTVTCDTDLLKLENPGCNNCCRGVNNRRYASRCLPKKSFVMALVRLSPDATFDWNWIQLTTSCSCAVSPLSGT